MTAGRRRGAARRRRFRQCPGPRCGNQPGSELNAMTDGAAISNAAAISRASSGRGT
jgi:hypothetical protein